jgi:hypothetical protein
MKHAEGMRRMSAIIFLIDGQYSGEIVACMDHDEYSESHPREQRSYLTQGIMVDTDFGGLVHYPDGEHERIVLLSRAVAAG